MMSDGNMQNGDLTVEWNYYKKVIKILKPYVVSRSSVCNILNLGAGSIFRFEKMINDIYKECVNLYSLDINLPKKKIPKYISFYNRSVEELFEMPVKMDIVCFFELIEHIDKTDILLQNCHNNMSRNGLLICSCPNLASIYSRIELLMGCQPHILEASNMYPKCGMGIFGKMNYGIDNNESIHHIRGLTHGAMKELLSHHGFEIIRAYGYTKGIKLLKYPGLASDVLYVCKKQ